MPALIESEFIVTLTNFDSTSQSEILSYLHNHGIYTIPNQTAMVSLDNPAPPPATDIAEFAGSNFTANVTEPGPHHITAVLGIGLASLKRRQRSRA